MFHKKGRYVEKISQSIILKLNEKALFVACGYRSQIYENSFFYKNYLLQKFLFLNLFADFN